MGKPAKFAKIRSRENSCHTVLNPNSCQLQSSIICPRASLMRSRPFDDIGGKKIRFTRYLETELTDFVSGLPSRPTTSHDITDDIRDHFRFPFCVCGSVCAKEDLTIKKKKKKKKTQRQFILPKILLPET